jgi:hypothetical protein
MVHYLGMMETARGMLQIAVATKLASWVDSPQIKTEKGAKPARPHFNL